jgi:hypothetical protein
MSVQTTREPFALAFGGLECRLPRARKVVTFLVGKRASKNVVSSARSGERARDGGRNGGNGLIFRGDIRLPKHSRLRRLLLQHTCFPSHPYRFLPVSSLEKHFSRRGNKRFPGRLAHSITVQHETRGQTLDPKCLRCTHFPFLCVETKSTGLVQCRTFAIFRWEAVLQ